MHQRTRDVQLPITVDVRHLVICAKRTLIGNRAPLPIRVLIPNEPASRAAANDQIGPTVTVQISHPLAPRVTRTVSIHDYAFERDASRIGCARLTPTKDNQVRDNQPSSVTMARFCAKFDHRPTRPRRLRLALVDLPARAPRRL